MAISTRRTFLAAGLTSLAGLCAKNATAKITRGFFAKHGLPIGMQLYTVADAARADLDGSLAKLASIGFKTVELAGFHGHDVASLRAAAERAGRKFTSIHVNAQPRGADPGLDGDIPKLCADLHALGVKRAVMPLFLMPRDLSAPAPNESFLAFLYRVAERLTADDWKRTAAFLNEKGALLKREGIPLGYHNHNPEFAPLQGVTGFEILMRETDPALVSFELDAGWVAAAGLDPVALLAQYPNRFRQMHVKDIRATTPVNYAFRQDPTEVGRGRMAWPKLLQASWAAGIREFYVEQEPPFEKDRFDALADSFNYLTRA